MSEPGAIPFLARIVAGATGAALVLRESWSASDLGSPSRLWAAVMVVVLSVAMAWLLPELRRILPRPGDVPLVFGAVLATSYLCVPETDQIPRVAVVVTIVVITEGVSRHRLPIVVIGLVAAYVMWAGVFGATGRQSALVGTFVAWWPVVLLPLLTRWRPALAAVGPWPPGAIVAVCAVAATVVARTGALEPTVGPALIATAIALPVSLLIAIAITLLTTRHRPHGATPGQPSSGPAAPTPGTTA